MVGDLFDSSRNIIEDVVLKGQVPVLVAGSSPVKHIDIKTLVREVFHQTIAWHQVQDIRSINQCVDKQYGHRIAFLQCRFIVIQFGFVLSPNDFFGCLSRGRFGTIQNDLHTLDILLEHIIEFGCRCCTILYLYSH